MRISDWSSDVCSSDLKPDRAAEEEDDPPGGKARQDRDAVERTCRRSAEDERGDEQADTRRDRLPQQIDADRPPAPLRRAHEIGRASCRERMYQYGESSVWTRSLKKKRTQ